MGNVSVKSEYDITHKETLSSFYPQSNIPGSKLMFISMDIGKGFPKLEFTLYSVNKDSEPIFTKKIFEKSQ